jgi:ATP-dependent Clp protease ATP-binding subunit ClpA
MRRRRRTPARAVPLMTAEARAIQMGAFEDALRLGHAYVGSEHTLLALAGADHPAAAVLREHGVTPGRVEEQVVRLAGGGLFGDLDRNALAAVGIDVDAVRDRMTETFGREALSRAGQAATAHPWGIAGPRWDPRRRGGPGIHAGGVFRPHSPDAAQFLRNARAEQLDRHDPQIGVEHFALSLLSLTDGQVPPILAALGVETSALRAAVIDRCPATGEPPREQGRG